MNSIRILTDQDGQRTILVKTFSKQYKEKLEKLEKLERNFIKLVKKGNVSHVLNFLSDESNLKLLRCQEDYCLNFCAGNGYEHLVKALVEYGYLKIKFNVELHVLIQEPIKKASINGHLGVVKYLYGVGGPQLYPFLKTLYLTNFGCEKTIKVDDKSDVNYLSRIKKLQEDTEKMNIYNACHKKAKNTMTMENELLLTEYNLQETGEEYDENYKFSDDDEPEAEVPEEVEEVEEVEDENGSGDEMDIDENDEPKSETGSVDDDLFGSDSEADTEEVAETPKIAKKVLAKKIVSTSFVKKWRVKTDLKKKDSNFVSYKKEQKSKTMDVILWYLSKGIMIRTNYNFVSRYSVNHNLVDTIEILKKNNKFKVSDYYTDSVGSVGSLDFEKANIV